jgi:glycosyltransferase involved in cell wall biosynthesis
MPGAGGGSLRTHEINRRLFAHNYQVTVLTTRFPGCVDQVRDGVRYVHVGLGQGNNRLTRLIGYILRLPAAVRAHPDADLIVEDFFPPFSSMAVPLWSRRPVIGLVQWLHAREKARQYKLPFHLLERATVLAHRRLIAVSVGTAERLLSLNPRAHVDVIGNGVDIALFETPACLGSDVLFIGRLELGGKGLDLLLHAWSVACPGLDGRLMIAGTGLDEAKIRQLANRLGISDRVSFLGWVGGEDKVRLLNRSRLVVVPSRQETFGLVAIEALAAATPVIAFDIPCLREIVPADCGWLVKPFDISALAARLSSLYGDKEQLLAAGHRGREFAVEFDWDLLAELQAQAYQDALLRPCPPAGWSKVRLRPFGQDGDDHLPTLMSPSVGYRAATPQPITGDDHEHYVGRTSADSPGRQERTTRRPRLEPGAT